MTLRTSNLLYFDSKLLTELFYGCQVGTANICFVQYFFLASPLDSTITHCSRKQGPVLNDNKYRISNWLLKRWIKKSVIPEHIKYEFCRKKTAHTLFIYVAKSNSHFSALTFLLYWQQWRQWPFFSDTTAWSFSSYFSGCSFLNSLAVSSSSAWPLSLECTVLISLWYFLFPNSFTPNTDLYQYPDSWNQLPTWHFHLDIHYTCEIQYVPNQL